MALKRRPLPVLLSSQVDTVLALSPLANCHPVSFPFLVSNIACQESIQEFTSFLWQDYLCHWLLMVCVRSIATHEPFSYCCSPPTLPLEKNSFTHWGYFFLLHFLISFLPLMFCALIHRNIWNSDFSVKWRFCSFACFKQCDEFNRSFSIFE